MRAVNMSRKMSVLVSIGLCIACTTLPKLDVTYQTLPKASTLPVREIYFTLTDQRPTSDIIGPGAKRVYKDFAGNITLIVATGPEERSAIGLYGVRELFHHVLTRYLENRGLTLSPEPKEGLPRLEVAIRDFMLDLAESRWIARIAFEVEFSYHGRSVIQRYQGEGEKLRISGLTQAHQVMSETFTETIHQLDVGEMVSAFGERQ
jgi:hypothetical protein